MVEKKIIDEYVRIVAKNTEFFSTYDPETLLGMMASYAKEQQGAKIQFAKDKYKATIQIPTERENLSFKVRVLKVDQEKNCLEFSRVSGDQLEFFEVFNTIKGYYGAINNAAF